MGTTDMYYFKNFTILYNIHYLVSFDLYFCLVYIISHIIDFTPSACVNNELNKVVQ